MFVLESLLSEFSTGEIRQSGGSEQQCSLAREQVYPGQCKPELGSTLIQRDYLEEQEENLFPRSVQSLTSLLRVPILTMVFLMLLQQQS